MNIKLNAEDIKAKRITKDTIPNKASIIHIVKCCQKGWFQVTKLVMALNDIGIIYDLHQVKPDKCTQLLELCGLDIKTANSKPHIYIEGIIFQAEKINDEAFLSKLIEDLIIINKENKD